MIRVGLISDTHGLLRPQAEAFLRGADHIVHAGDIGDPAILSRLSAIAPLTAVRGNNDTAGWAAQVAATETFTIAGVVLHVLHDLGELEDDHARAARVVVCGHSHKPRVDEHDGLMIVNPGSAGPRRFSLPVAVAELLIDGGAVSARIVELRP